MSSATKIAKLDPEMRPGVIAAGPATPDSARNPAPRKGVKVCHLSPIENGRDSRAYVRQALPTTSYGLSTSIVGPHGLRDSIQKVQFIPLAKSRSRALRMLRASKGVFRALRQKADIYHVHNPENIPAGLLLKLLFRKRVVYDSREDFPAMMLNKTYLSPGLRKLAQKAVFKAEQLAANYFDGFVTADAGTLRPHAKYGRSRKLVFYNLPNLEFFPKPVGGDKPFDLVYRGGLSERAGTFVLLDAVRLLADEGLRTSLLMFGYTDNDEARRSITDRIQALQLENQVTLAGRIPHDRMAATLGQARIAVSPLQDNPKFLNNIPVKVFESWACELPVVSSDLPPIRPFYHRDQYHLLVKPGEPKALARAIGDLLDRPDEILRIGKQCRQKVIERYNNAVEIRKLLFFYRKVLAS
jgi:glycosyltransferase involved in cell wall biosynthesis